MIKNSPEIFRKHKKTRHNRFEFLTYNNSKEKFGLAGKRIEV